LAWPAKVLARKKFTQRQLLTYTANMQTSLIGMEACSGAHFLGRTLRKQGHDVRLMAAQFVKPFVKSNKNDYVDAEAIAEAVERKNMRFVPIKTDDQLDLQAIHRVRDRLISRRTALINQLRAFLLERGLVFAKTPAKLRAALPDILENADLDLTPQMRSLIDLLWKEWKIVEDQIKGLSFDLERISAADPGCTRIRWEADDFGMGADERARRTTRGSFDGSTFRPTDSCLGDQRVGGWFPTGPPSPDPVS
jgi:transposase